MSKEERDDIIIRKLDHIEGKLDKLYAVIFFDNDTGKHGLYADNEATKQFQLEIIQEVGALRSSQEGITGKIDTIVISMDNAVDKLAEIALWKEGIQAAPKTAGKIIFWTAGFFGAIGGIYVFIQKYILGK